MMGNNTSRAGIAALIILTCGCSRPPRLLDVPVQTDSTGTLITFADSSRASGAAWLLWMEFESPSESDHASQMQAVLISPDGQWDTLQVFDVDRRGERIVSLEGRLPYDRAAVYQAVELRSNRPLRLRQIRGSATAD